MLDKEKGEAQIRLLIAEGASPADARESVERAHRFCKAFTTLLEQHFPDKDMNQFTGIVGKAVALRILNVNIGVALQISGAVAALQMAAHEARMQEEEESQR